MPLRLETSYTITGNLFLVACQIGQFKRPGFRSFSIIGSFTGFQDIPNAPSLIEESEVGF
jgi:hypothetical protein